MQHRPVTLRRRTGEDYASLIKRPLHILALLMPLILAFEIGSRLYLTGESAPIQTIRAHSLLLGFFRDLGIAGPSLPSIAIILALVIWHLSVHHRWKVRPAVVLGMAGESLALTMPLVVFFALLNMALGAEPRPAWQPDVADPLAKLPWKSAVIVAIGAGLYEEFLFRFLGVSAMRLLLVDLGKVSARAGTITAVVLSAAAFTAYHDVASPHGGIDAMKAASFLVAGLYFGAVFALRGFGIAVGVHVVYDICALALAGRTPV